MVVELLSLCVVPLSVGALFVAGLWICCGARGNPPREPRAEETREQHGSRSSGLIEELMHDFMLSPEINGEYPDKILDDLFKEYNKWLEHLQTSMESRVNRIHAHKVSYKPCSRHAKKQRTKSPPATAMLSLTESESGAPSECPTPVQSPSRDPLHSQIPLRIDTGSSCSPTARQRLYDFTLGRMWKSLPDVGEVTVPGKSIPHVSSAGSSRDDWKTVPSRYVRPCKKRSKGPRYVSPVGKRTDSSGSSTQSLLSSNRSSSYEHCAEDQAADNLVVERRLKKLIPPGVVFLQTRPDTVLFMEQPAIDRIEMNLKHKRIENQWGVVTIYKKSMALMIPKAPPLPPRIKPSGAPVVFEAVDTPFLSKEVRDNLEFHVKRKKLQHQWGLPMMVQESLNAFIPPAPKLIVSELNPKPQYQIVVEVSDLPFISEKHRKDVEFNIKRRIIHRRWGYPKFVIMSLKSMCPPASIAKDLLQQKETESLTHSSPSEKGKALDKKPHLSVPAKGTAQNDSKLRAQDVEFSFKNRDPDVIDRFEVHLSMKCIAIKLEMIPKIVQHSYKICLPVVKIPLKKIIPPGVVFLQKRPDSIFFMEQPRIDRIEMNLKHKRIENQWGVVTMYKKSMALMIPKAPPLPPRIKPSGAPVVFEAVDTPFLSKEVRDNLEFHVKRKKLQHQWGLPMMVQELLNAFIPPAPKLIVSELNPKPQYQVVVELSDLSFISEKHRKDVEFNIKRKIIHRRWGYPKFVITSLKSMCPPASISKDLLQQIEAESLTHSSLSEKRKVLKALDKKPHLSVPAKGTAQHDSKLRAQDVQFSFKNIDPDVIDRFEVHLSMKCLAIRLEMIPKIVQHSYKICSPLVKIPLKKIILPGVVFLQKRPDSIFFMEQPRIDRIEMNLKHKRIENQWGVLTMYRKSMALMIPKAPPLPPRIKPSGAPVVFEAVDTPFLSKEVRDNLEFHVKRKKLQHQWGLPMMVQESLNAFIPPAPKLIVSELNPKPQYQIVVELSDLSFVSEKHRKDVEFNIKRKIIHRRWGYPKFVITSLKSMCPPASIAKDLLQQKEAESLTHSSLSEKRKVLKALDKKPHLSVPAKGTAQKDSKLRAEDVEFSFKNRDPDVIDRFEVHLSMKCIAIKLEMIPKIVQHSYKICLPVVKIPLKKIIPPGVVFLQKRPDCIFFMEQPRIDRIEMNLKHKRIENQWGVVTMYKKSMALMIPKAPPLPPRIKPSGAPVVFEAVDTPFLSKEVRDNLEFHVKRKKLQHQWGLPMMVQESLNAFIPAAPKLIVSELNPKPQYQVVVELSDLSFISEKHRKDVEFNIKRKIIHRRWGYPKFVITSLKSVFPPASIAKDLLQQKEVESLTHSCPSEKGKALDKKPDLSVPAEGTAPNDSKLRAQDVQFSFKNIDPDVIDRFEVHLSMKCLAIRLEMIPKIVQHSYEICSPLVKIPLKKIIPPGMVFLQKRPDCIFFMEQPRIDRIEMNLKHKRIENQWGVVTMYKKSMALIIPKAPPLPPRIKPSGAPVVFEAVDTPFLSKEVRDNLEFHVKRKKLQHQWGLPMMVQESLKAFIPAAPKLIVSELNPKPQYQVVVELSDLSFISEKHRKDVEFNIKRKIIHRRWGYPKFVITSLKSMCPPASIAKDLLQQKEAESLTHSSLSEKRKVLKALDKKPHLSVPAKGTAQKDSKLRAQDVEFSFKNRDPDIIDRFEVHLSMKCLAIRLEMIPKIVQHSYKICLPVVKIPLKKIIPPGVVFLQKRPDCIFFMEQPRIDRIEMNLKHKRIENQWGVVTMYKKSMALMIPKAPPLPPRIKPSGAPVVFEAVDTPFLSKEVRDNLEFHVKRKKLQHQWGLPMMVQESLNAFIPPAPKLIVSELNPKPQYQVVVELSDLPFISEKHGKDVEFNIKRKIIHRRWGYPKFVITSLKSMCPPASIAKDLLQEIEAESLTHSSPSEIGKALDKKPHLSVPAKGTAQKDSKLRAQDVEFSFKNRDPDIIDRFEVHLSMKCLAIRLEMIPKIVQHSYEICFPVVKIPLKKIIPPGVVFLQKRPDSIFFMEQPRIDRIEMNLKHKRIENQWGVVTMYKKSMALMIPKAPPLPPRIKPSGVPVVFEAVDTPFLSKEVRDNLEFHVSRKKLQHQWGLPMMVQESLNAFIPLAPKLIVSELHVKPEYKVIVELSDLLFISEMHRKTVEDNIKLKIRHKRWVYPKFVITSLKSMCPPSSIAKDLLQQKEAESLTHSSPSEKGKALDKKPDLSFSAEGTAQNDSKLRAQNVEFLFKNRDPEVIDRFEVHLSMKCLAIKLEMIPKIMQTSYKIAFSVVKIPLKKRIPPGVVFLQKRPDSIFFMEQPAIDRIEMNLKHKRIENQWGVVTMYKKSMALMIPKAPPLPPRIKPSGAPVVFEAVDTPFLSKEVRDNLEFHVKRKKLQHQWGLPMMVQESLNAFIPPAPKLIVSELNPKPQYQVVVELSDLSFISEKHRKDVEFNIKRKIIHRRWGYPKFVITSLKSMCPPASIAKDLLQQKETESLTHSSPSEKGNALEKKPDLCVPAEGTAPNDSKLRASDVLFSFKNRDPDIIDRFEVHLSMKCLTIRLEMIPKIVQHSYKIAFSVVKIPLKKIIPPGVVILQKRPDSIFFMEQPRIDRIEMNLKHKRIENQWGVVTMYKKSMALMIPKAPPLPPRIKPSGAPVVFEAVDTLFLSKEVRDNLEFHVKRKKLQHQWGLPMMVQESLNAFIPPAPKLIVSELNPKPQYQIVVELSDLPFISEKHRKDVEFNIKRKIIHKRWGYPKFVITSLKSVFPPASIAKDLLQQKEVESLTHSCPSEKGKALDKKPDLSVPAEGTAPNDSKLRAQDVLFSFKNRDPVVIDRFEVHLSMKCLAIRLEIIPKIVQHSYIIAFSVVKIPLKKRIPPGVVFLQKRPDSIFFMEQPAIDRIEMNFKHKRIEKQWGVGTIYKKSMALMIPKAPPLPPRIKPSGAPVVFEAVDTPFLSNEVRDNLEFHVKRKKLQHQWGLPMMVQESLKAFIPPAPKLIVSELNPKPQYQIVVELSDLPFISEKHRKDVEFNIKRRIIHRRWGYPKFVITSLKSMCPPASIAKDLLQQKETESLTHSSPSEKGNALEKKPDLCVPAEGTAPNDSKLRASDVLFSFKNRDPEVIDRFEVHLSMKCLAMRLEMIPKIVQHSYIIAFSVVKIPLKKIIPPGVVFLQKRPDSIFFVEQPAIDRIEMNLKHKRIENQWGVVTMYKTSMALMIPKAPPLPPRIKPSGAPVVFEAVDTPLLSKEVRDNLEFHVKRKKLQHQWGLPMMVQESLNAFIPPAPKLIVSELHPKPEYKVTVELSDLLFISKTHRKTVEDNIKLKIMHKRWGYPKFVIKSLKSMCPPASIAKDLLQQKEAESLTHSTSSEKGKALDKKPDISVPSEGTTQNDSKLRAQDVQFSFKNRDPDVIDRFEVHLSMKCLAIKLKMIPKIVQHSYEICFPVVKIPLKKIIPPGVVFLQKRPDSIFFMEQPRIDRIEMNLKHKRIENQWGVVTMYKKSMALMIPKAPPLPPRIKPSGAPVVFEAVDTPFLSNEVRDNLEFHVKRKKLQHQWGLPMMVQESLNAFIPAAPKLIVSELHSKPEYKVIVELSDLLFISETHRKTVEDNIKRKIIHRRWGHPKFVITSLKSMCPPASIAKDLLQQTKAESLIHSSPPEKQKALDKNPDLSVPAEGTAQNDSKLRAQDVEFSFKNRGPEFIDRFEVHLSMKCLAIKLEMIPKIVTHSYEICFPVVKIPLKKIIPPGVVFLQKRPDCIFFMEQPRIDRIEMNLKHKRIENQWGVVTMYKKSMALMIPKAPPLPPQIKPSGAPVIFEAVDTPFLSKEVRDNLEFHVKRKKLQHQWGLPMMVQESLNAFIPPAPKLIISELHPKPQYQIVVELSDLDFISETHRKTVQDNIKIKIMHKRWGLAKFAMESIQKFPPPAAIAHDLKEIKEKDGLTNTDHTEKEKEEKKIIEGNSKLAMDIDIPQKTGSEKSDAELDSSAGDVKNPLERHLLLRQGHFKEHYLPPIVEKSLELCRPPPAPPLPPVLSQKTDPDIQPQCSSSGLKAHVGDVNKSTSTTDVETRVPCRKEMKGKLEFHLIKQLLSQLLNHPYPGSDFHEAPELPHFLKHGRCTCCDYPYDRVIVSDEMGPADQEGSSSEEASEPSVITKDLHPSLDSLKEHLQAHLLQKKFMDCGLLPHCALKSHTNYAQAEMERERSTDQAIRTKLSDKMQKRRKEIVAGRMPERKGSQDDQLDEGREIASGKSPRRCELKAGGKKHPDSDRRVGFASMPVCKTTVCHTSPNNNLQHKNPVEESEINPLPPASVPEEKQRRRSRPKEVTCSSDPLPEGLQTYSAEIYVRVHKIAGGSRRMSQHETPDRASPPRAGRQRTGVPKEKTSAETKSRTPKNQTEETLAASRPEIQGYYYCDSEEKGPVTHESCAFDPDSLGRSREGKRRTSKEGSARERPSRTHKHERSSSKTRRQRNGHSDDVIVQGAVHVNSIGDDRIASQKKCYKKRKGSRSKEQRPTSSSEEEGRRVQSLRRKSKPRREERGNKGPHEPPCFSGDRNVLKYHNRMGADQRKRSSEKAPKSTVTEIHLIYKTEEQAQVEKPPRIKEWFQSFWMSSKQRVTQLGGGAGV